MLSFMSKHTQVGLDSLLAHHSPITRPTPAMPRDVHAHCSAPPLQVSFRLPRLSRDVEAVIRPRTPLRPTKQEGGSETGAEAEFVLDDADEAKVKVEAEEQIEVAEDPRQLCARLAVVRIVQQDPAANQPRGPIRPKG